MIRRSTTSKLAIIQNTNVILSRPDRIRWNSKDTRDRKVHTGQRRGGLHPVIHSTRDYAVTFQRRSPTLQNTRAWTRESRSRLLRSSCSRRSREIASGHYGRLLTASPPATSTLPCLLFYLPFSSFGSVRFSFLRHTEARTLTNLFSIPLLSILLLPPFSTSRAGQVLSCGMRCAPVASTSTWSPLTTTCTDPQTGCTLSSP